MKAKTEKDYDIEFQQWLDENPTSEVEEIDFDGVRQDVIDALTYVSSMSVQEYTLYEKWKEIRRKYPTKKMSTLLGEEEVLEDDTKILEIKKCANKIWVPESPEDYEKLEPEVLYTNNGNDADHLMRDWSHMRVFISTMLHNSAVGRNMHFLIRDRVTEKYLGVVCISSDFMDLTARDEYIGWSRKVKTDERMINHIAIGSTIVPTQPLGFNFLGGKLCALLCLSDDVQNAWKDTYNQTLVGLTTTSLYGTLSQYNSLQYWNKRGKTKGSIGYNPGRELRKKMMTYIQKTEPRKYWEWFHAMNEKNQRLKRDYRNRALLHAYRKFDIPKELIHTEHSRGIYFSPLYNNTCEFLRKEITEDKLEKRMDTSIEHLVDVWKKRYAGPRAEKMVEQGRYNTNTLFYEDLIYMDDFEEVKAKYLPKVGIDR